MHHLLIFIPGLMGSTLKKDGRAVWARSVQALWELVRTRGEIIQTLLVGGDDGRTDDLGDGIKATGLLSDIHHLPRFGSHAGYSVIVRRLEEAFGLQAGSIHAPRPSDNFFTFPYDWRRDNRVTARQLQRFIEQQLPQWRDHSGAKNAQVILIGHSMGGLIARYYAEVLGGWEVCRGLITFGSPHRGALNSLAVLANGIHSLLDGSGMNEVVRSFESVYQLLPLYPVIEAGGADKRITELDTLANVDLMRAKTARTNFLQAILESAENNPRRMEYQSRTLPWIGVRQPTAQSATVRDGHLALLNTPPTGLPESLADGDGTVPRVAALPVDLEGAGRERFVVEQHGWLTNHPMALEPLTETVRQLAAPSTINLRGDTEPNPAGLSLRVEDFYDRGAPVTVQLQLATTAAQTRTVRVQVTPPSPGESSMVTAQISSLEPSQLNLGELAPGLYTMEATVQGQFAGAGVVHGAFEVIDAHG